MERADVRRGLRRVAGGLRPLAAAIAVTAAMVALLAAAPPLHAKPLPPSRTAAAAGPPGQTAAPTQPPAPTQTPGAKPPAAPLASSDQAPAKLAAPPLDRRDYALIYLAIGVVTALAAFVPLGPIISYIWRGWAWRAQVIGCSLGDAAKDLYLSLFLKQAPSVETAGKRFDAYYRRWYGRSRLILPALLFGLIVVLFAFLVALFAAEQLFQATLPALANPVTIVAAAAITGAYMNVGLEVIARVNRRDLSPEDLFTGSLRMIVAAPIGYAVASLAAPDLKPFLAFAVGVFPLQQLVDVLRKLAAKQLGAGDAGDAVSDLTTKLSGVDATVSERLASIGITTVPQLAYSDVIQLTMRTNMNFNFVLDLVSQALAFIYLDDKLVTLRPMGLRGAYELAVLCYEARADGDSNHANSIAVIKQAADAIKVTPEEFNNTLHAIADDPYMQFLTEAYGS